MEFVHIFTVLVLSLCYSKVYCRPQWRPMSVDSFDPNKSFSLSKTLDFNNKHSSIGGSLGYDRTSGFGLGLKGSHTFGKGTTLHGSIYKSQRGGSTNTLGFNQKFKTGTNIFGSNTNFRGGISNTLGLGQNIGKRTSVFGSRTNTNIHGFKVRQYNVGLTHKFKNGGSLSASYGRSNIGGNQYGVKLNIPFGK